MNEISPAQARIIAELVRTIRPDWTLPAIGNAILTLKRRPAWKVAAAACRAAEDPTITSPAGIAFTDLHTTQRSLEDIFVSLVSERAPETATAAVEGAR